jgi:hypothetical protein
MEQASHDQNTRACTKREQAGPRPPNDLNLSHSHHLTSIF